MLDDARIPKHNGMWRYIYIYKTIGSYHDIIAYSNISYDSRIDSYPYSITDSRITFAASSVHLPDDNSLVDIAVASYLRLAIDGDVIGMAQIQAPPQSVD